MVCRNSSNQCSPFTIKNLSNQKHFLNKHLELSNAPTKSGVLVTCTFWKDLLTFHFTTESTVTQRSILKLRLTWCLPSQKILSTYTTLSETSYCCILTAIYKRQLSMVSSWWKIQTTSCLLAPKIWHFKLLTLASSMVSMVRLSQCTGTYWSNLPNHSLKLKFLTILRLQVGCMSLAFPKLAVMRDLNSQFSKMNLTLWPTSNNP